MKIIELNTNEYEKLVKKGLIEEDKKIEKIKVLNSDDENDISSLGVTLDLKTLKNKTNEIIDYLMENKQ